MLVVQIPEVYITSL